MTKVSPLVLGCSLLLLTCKAVRAADQPAQPAAPVSYYRDVRPILQQHCQGCHQPARAQGGYVMTSYPDLFKKGISEKPGIVAGKAAESLLLDEILPRKDKPPRMPKNKPPLTEPDVARIRAWIAEGAKDDTPVSDRLLIDMDHPPGYELPPVVTAIAYSRDGNLLAVSGYHEVLLHKSDGSGLVGRLVGLAERVQSLAFSPDGKLLAVAGGSPARFGEIQVWDVEKRKLKAAHTVTFDTVYGVSWSPDSLVLAFGCADNTLRAIDADTGKQLLYQGAHSDWVLGSVFSREGTFIASVSRDRSMKLTEFATQRFIDNITSITPGALKGGLLSVARRPIAEKKMSKVPPDTPKAAPFVYDELLVGGSDGVPRLYKMHREAKRVIGDDFNKIREFESLPGRIYSLSFSLDGNLFVAGSSLDGSGEARIYQAADGKRVAKLDGVRGAVYSVAFHPAGKQVATAGFDGIIRLHDAGSGKLVKDFVAVPLQPRKLVSSPRP